MKAGLEEMHLALKAAKKTLPFSVHAGVWEIPAIPPRSGKIEQDAVNEFEGKKNATSLVDEDSVLAPTSEVS